MYLYDPLGEGEETLFAVLWEEFRNFLCLIKGSLGREYRCTWPFSGPYLDQHHSPHPTEWGKGSFYFKYCCLQHFNLDLRPGGWGGGSCFRNVWKQPRFSFFEILEPVCWAGVDRARPEMEEGLSEWSAQTATLLSLKTPLWKTASSLLLVPIPHTDVKKK